MKDIFSLIELAALILLGVGLCFALIRAIRGPRIADRIVGGNMAGTMTTMCIAILADLLHQDWLLDVCLIYCMISFLAVVVLSKIYISVDREHKNRAKEKEAKLQ